MIAMTPSQSSTKCRQTLGNRHPFEGLFSVALFALTAASAGCNAIFGIEAASETGGGGQAASSGNTTSSATGGGGMGSGGKTSETTTASGGTGGSEGTTTTNTGGTGGGVQCEVYWGDGNIQWTDLGGSNLPVVKLQTAGSVSSSYLPQYDNTVISMGSFLNGYCAAGAGITFAGAPIVGQVYSIVGRSTYLNNAEFHAGKNAFIETAARPFNGSGNCDSPEADAHWFESEPGIGSFTVVSLVGTVLSFKAEGVQVIPTVGPNYDGTGKSGVEIDGLSECYSGG